MSSLISQRREWGPPHLRYQRAFGRASNLINYVGLDYSIIDYVCEIEGSLKISECMPGAPDPRGRRERTFEDCAIIFSWHIAAEFAPKLRAKGFKGKLITPLPTLHFL